MTGGKTDSLTAVKQPLRQRLLLGLTCPSRCRFAALRQRARSSQSRSVVTAARAIGAAHIGPMPRQKAELRKGGAVQRTQSRFGPRTSIPSIWTNTLVEWRFGALCLRCTIRLGSKWTAESMLTHAPHWSQRRKLI